MMKLHCIGASLLTIASVSCWADRAAAQTAAAKEEASAQPATPDESDEAAQSADKPVVLNTDAKKAARARKGKRRSSDDAPGDIEVTGSRLSNGDPTTHVIVIDREQIERSGVSSVEDLIRTLPQNVATIGSITNSRTSNRSPLNDRRAPISGIGSLGVSAANLGGVGAGNTLILVNGRRLAGAAGIEDGFVNLNGIPLSAIERVEISQNGASAVYGADAMGGVINFILKKRYSGVTLNGQFEHSNNGANRVRTSAYVGKAWRTGNFSATLEYLKTNPIVNARTGYVTENYAPIFNGNPAFDFRNFSRGLQPGVIDRTASAFNPATNSFVTTVTGLTVRPGLVGRPGLTDFISVGKDAARDYIAEFAGPDADSISGTFNFEQSITGRLKVFGNGIVSRNTNSQQQDLRNGLTLTLAPGQAYNPFRAFPFDTFSPGITVNYFPGAEIADGTLVAGTLKNVSTTWSANVGTSYDFNQDTRLSLIYTTSRSTTRGSGSILGQIAQPLFDPTRPNSISCFDFFLSRSPATDNMTDAVRAARQAAFDRQCALVTSADPSVAFNPWRSGEPVGGGNIQDFIYDNAVEDLGSRLQLFEARLNGNLLTLPGGKLMYSVGGEYADDGVRSDVINTLTGSSQSRDRYAFFGEINVPIFGGDFTLPLMKSLLFNIAGRDDTYETTGAIGTVNNVPLTQGGQLRFEKSTFSRFTPAWGFRWSPADGIALQGRWTRGFKAPPYTQLFNPAGTTVTTTTITNDPLYRCTTDCSSDRNGVYSYRTPTVTAPNPDLKPQVSRQQSFTLSLNPQGFLRGLSFAATYNHTRIDSEYAAPRDLQQLLTSQQILAIPLFYPRDATGKVTQFRQLTFNIVGSEYESMTYELRYPFDTAIGRFEPGALVVQNIKASRQAQPGSPVVDRIGTILGPDRFRVNGQLGWSLGNWSATLLGYYTPGYDNDYLSPFAAGLITNRELIQRVRAYTTFDLTATWQATDSVRMSFAGRNIFDAKPPFTVVEQRPYDTARYNVAGRTLSLQMAYSF